MMRVLMLVMALCLAVSEGVESYRHTYGQSHVSSLERSKATPISEKEKQMGLTPGAGEKTNVGGALGTGGNGADSDGDSDSAHTAAEEPGEAASITMVREYAVCVNGMQSWGTDFKERISAIGTVCETLPGYVDKLHELKVPVHKSFLQVMHWMMFTGTWITWWGTLIVSSLPFQYYQYASTALAWWGAYSTYKTKMENGKIGLAAIWKRAGNTYKKMMNTKPEAGAARSLSLEKNQHQSFLQIGEEPAVFQQPFGNWSVEDMHRPAPHMDLEVPPPYAMPYTPPAPPVQASSPQDTLALQQEVKELRAEVHRLGEQVHQMSPQAPGMMKPWVGGAFRAMRSPYPAKDVWAPFAYEKVDAVPTGKNMTQLHESMNLLQVEAGKPFQAGDVKSMSAKFTKEEIVAIIAGIDMLREMLDVSGDGISDLMDRASAMVDQLVCVKNQIFDLIQEGFTVPQWVIGLYWLLNISARCLWQLWTPMYIQPWSGYNLFHHLLRINTLYVNKLFLGYSWAGSMQHGPASLVAPMDLTKRVEAPEWAALPNKMMEMDMSQVMAKSVNKMQAAGNVEKAAAH